ncbi:MAG: hypothetical protein DRQ52_03720 [Gammaproteobacteria bacterium]|nr:MAG: hypothetical protein DRQ52_03720 [Gammaproteobacteria bacterium]
MNEPEKTSADIDEQMVANYLTDHPDFFLRHLQLVSELKIPHGERGSISLVERQLDVQRERYRQLQGKMQQLIDNADTNQAVYDRIGTLAIALAKSGSLKELLQTLCDQLADNFSVDAVAIQLPARTGDQWPSPVHTLHDPDADALPDSIKTPYLGTPPAQMDLIDLFGEQASDVASVAILSVGDRKNGGHLLLASYDEERFRGDLGTSLLTQIAELFGALLSHHWADSD